MASAPNLPAIKGEPASTGEWVAIEPAAHHLALLDADKRRATLLRLWLEERSYRVSVANTEEQARELLDSGPELSAILIDAALPNQAWRGLLGSIRLQPRLELVPVLMMSEPGQTAEIAWGLSHGASDHLSVPVHEAILEARVRNHLLLATMQRKLREQSDRLLHMSSTDPVTGLPNRSSLDAALPREHRRTLRYGRPLSLIVLGVDRLDDVKQRYGLSERDEIVAELAQRLPLLLRNCDLLFRFGTAEFAVLLPESDATAALSAAERIRAGIEGATFATTSGKLLVTVSQGVATLMPSRSYPDTPTWRRAALAALAKAQTQGGNCIVSDTGVAG